MSAKISWSHILELLSLNNIEKIQYYLMICNLENLSVRALRSKIKNKEYDRLDEETKRKLINKEENSIKDYVKHPIVIKNTLNKEIISEKVLKQLILEDLDNFLKELGTGFCYIEQEYKIKVNNNYNYIDLLLYNFKFHCFVVVELKTIELKKEHIGQVDVYINYIDKNIKSIGDNKTVGIIITKKDNEYIIEYSSNPNISSTTNAFAYENHCS